MNRICFEACAECDLLLKPSQAAEGEIIQCPRCGYQLQQFRRQSIDRTFAFSVAGFALVIPANTLPILGIEVMGKTHDGTLWSGVMALYNEGMWGVSVLVCLASMVFPVLKVTLSLLISAHLYYDKAGRHLAVWMRYLHHLEEWAMLEVYTLGIIVACVKLAGVASLRFGYGLYAFVALLIVNCLMSASMDHHLFWRRIRRLRREFYDENR